jgi:hypothetical protein
MEPFRVRVLPLGSDCQLRVEGIKNTQWLLHRLSQSFVFKTSEGVHEDLGTRTVTFRVAYSSQTPRLALERLLASIPEVSVVPELF